MALLYAAAALNSVAFYLVPTQRPFLLARELGIDAPSRAGLAIGFATLVSAAVSVNFGHVRARLAPPLIFAAGFGAMAAGYGLVALAGGYALVLAGMALTGVSMGLVMPALMVLAVGAASEAQRGRVSGGLTSSLFLGQLASPLAVQPLVAALGLAAAFGVAALALLAPSAALVAAGLMRARPAPQTPATS